MRINGGRAFLLAGGMPISKKMGIMLSENSQLKKRFVGLK